jgi:U4/U6 small nuclear ribonucleoprotein PRP31
VLHAWIRRQYARRFPELESLVPGPAEYARAVAMIGNATDVAPLPLASILPQATVMGIAISVTTTAGRALLQEQLDRIREACATVAELDAARQRVLARIEARMTAIAPNVCAIVGSAIAARLLIEAGGLSALACTPANIVQLLGQKTLGTLGGFSTTAHRPHTGYIYDCESVQQTPPELRMRACRKVAGKVALAARIDFARRGGGGDESGGDALGKRMREFVDGRIEKELAPPPVKQDRALPAPDEKPKRRRGGRRLRKAKDRLE